MKNALAILLLCCSSAFAADSIEVKQYRIGDLIKLSQPDSVGWDVDAGLAAIPFEVNDDQTVFYAGTGNAPRQFVVKCSSIRTLKNGKMVSHVSQRYLVTIVAGDSPIPSPPSPTPTPSPSPTPAPQDILNELGVGLVTYQQAFAVADKPACVKAADSLEACAVGLEKSNGSEAAINASVKTVNQSISAALAGSKWDAARVAIANAMTASEQRAGGYNYLERCKLYREVASGFRAASR